MHELLSDLQVVGGALLQVGVLILCGFVLARLRVLGERDTDALVRVTVVLLLPMLILGTVVDRFRPGAKEFEGWILLPILALLFIAGAGLLGWVLYPLFAPRESRDPIQRRTFAAMSSVLNAGYLPLPILAALYADQPAKQAYAFVLCFLFILGMSPTMWGPVVTFLSGSRGRRDTLRRILSPPFLANIVAVGIALTGLPAAMPPRVLTAILQPVRWLGDCTIPVIMISLGTMLARIRPEHAVPRRIVLGVVFTKLILWPAVVFAVLAWGVRNRSWGEVMVVLLGLQALSPPATGLSLIGRSYCTESQSQMINQIILASYLASIVTIPLGLTLLRHWILR